MNSLTILVEHEFGNIVYLKADEENLPRMVCNYIINPPCTIMYRLQHASNDTSDHYDFEIVKEKSILIS